MVALHAGRSESTGQRVRSHICLLVTDDRHSAGTIDLDDGATFVQLYSTSFDAKVVWLLRWHKHEASAPFLGLIVYSVAIHDGVDVLGVSTCFNPVR
jgi:hypothetical protein